MSSYKPDSSTSQPFRWHYAELDDGDFQVRGRTLFFIAALFSAVILIVFLFLYARWVCRFGPYPHPPPPPLQIDSSAAARPPHAPRRGLDAATINSLPIVLHKSSVPGESECCICLGIFGDGEKVKVLPQCQHFFHSECVDKWLTTQSSCPLCRVSLRVDSPV
ncbi:hypothetical protein CASFOL_003143 [Castilleja foliolosa]|uniref:RING-type E3 ubiquitin transferase n=1 Tax=Castilleja foliolosa TaxID=1961234 RepID=A0ABD3EGA8_9LAMI